MTDKQLKALRELEKEYDCMTDDELRKHFESAPEGIGSFLAAHGDIIDINQGFKDGYQKAILDVVDYLEETDLPIDIEHWMKTKREFSAEVIKAAIAEIKERFK